jgi:hypothetical protein
LNLKLKLKLKLNVNNCLEIKIDYIWIIG